MEPGFVHFFFDLKFKDSVSRPFPIFQGLQLRGKIKPSNAHQMLEAESVLILVLDTCEAVLDKIGNKFQGLSSTDQNFQGL